jgi:hypothetical protein
MVSIVSDFKSNGTMHLLFYKPIENMANANRESSKQWIVFFSFLFNYFFIEMTLNQLVIALIIINGFTSLITIILGMGQNTHTKAT